MTIKELILKEVNEKGELHLDATKTKLICNYIENIETVSNELGAAAICAQRLIEDIDNMIKGAE